MKRQTILGACVLSLVVFSFSASSPAAGQAQGPDFKKLMDAWRDRAKRHLRDLKIYPNIDLKDVDPWVGKIDPVVLEEMGKSQDRQSEMDAYLRLQLLAFKPNMETAELKAIMPLMTAKPPLQPIPQPDKRQMKIFEAGVKEPLPEKHTKPHVDAYNNSTSVNSKNIEYRNTLSKTLPRKGGLRLYAMILDMKERYMAADPSYSKVRDAILKTEALEIWKSREGLAPKMQAQIWAMIEQLTAFGKDPLNRKIYKVEVEANNRIKISRLSEPLNGNQLKDLKQYITSVKAPE